MKLFQQKTTVHKFKSAGEFAEQYGIGKGDFILASKSIYEAYFAPQRLEAHVEYKSKYGVVTKALDDVSLNFPETESRPM